MTNIKVGDTIRCSDPDDLIEGSKALAMAGVQTDFLYEVDGEREREAIGLKL